MSSPRTIRPCLFLFVCAQGQIQCPKNRNHSMNFDESITASKNSSSSKLEHYWLPFCHLKHNKKSCMFVWHPTSTPDNTHDLTVLYLYEAELILLSNLCQDKHSFCFHKMNGIPPPLNLRPLSVKECAPQYLCNHVYLNVPLSLMKILEYF